MAGIVSTNRRKRRKSYSKSKARNQLNLQKPSGVIGHRVNPYLKRASSTG